MDVDHAIIAAILIPPSRSNEHAATFANMKIGNAKAKAVDGSVAVLDCQRQLPGAVRYHRRVMPPTKAALAGPGAERRYGMRTRKFDLDLPTMAIAANDWHSNRHYFWFW
jgi:hypothetical protein